MIGGQKEEDVYKRIIRRMKITRGQNAEDKRRERRKELNEKEEDKELELNCLPDPVSV
jgi:hypothetical protein